MKTPVGRTRKVLRRKKMPRDRIAVSTRGWQRLTTSLAANAADLPHLEAHRARLAELLTQVINLGNQQAVLTATKQEVTKQLQAAVTEARTVAAFLRLGVREKYGKDAEKLVEFGLQPFRGLRRRDEETEGPAPKAEETSPEAAGTPESKNRTA
jgi:hypothetical protein